jgi:uncharacterized protein
MRVIGEDLRLSPTDLANFLGCRHRSGLDLAVARGALAKPYWTDPLAEALRTRGEEHERQFIEGLRAQELNIVDLRDDDDAVARTVDLLKAGVDVVVQAQLQANGWTGYADVLRKVRRQSDLGPWSYEVYDTKLARDTRGGTILQLSAYSDMLAAIQGAMPEHFHVVTPDPVTPIHTYRVEDYAAYYRLMRQKLIDTLRVGSDVICAEHYPEPVEHCEVCRWFLRCNARRRADDHLSFIARVSRLHRGELVSQGYATLATAAAMPLPLAFKPARGAKATYESLREQARLQVEQRDRGRPVYELLDVEPEKGFCRLPAPSAGDLFLDFEGDPFAREGGREYLTGIGVARSEARPLRSDQFSYRAWWAFDDEQERAAFESVIDYMLERWAAFPDMHVYHFGHYEPSALKRLMGRHAARGEALDRLLRSGRFVDLHSVVRHALRAGVESYSIKKLEPFYDFSRDVSLDNAGVNLRALELALESQAPGLISDAMKDAVEGYNRDDCRSTLALRDWLEALRADLATRQEVPRPMPSADAPSERVNALDQAAEQLRSRLLEGVPALEKDRNAEEQVRWMLAYLIDWHRREEKADWWEFFRLCELPDEDLLDERKAIAGLEYVERVDVVLNKKSGRPTGSIIDRYTYPGQDVEIGRGNRLKVQSGKPWGEVANIDRNARILDVKKGPANADVHPQCVFADSVVPTETLQRSVMRLAEGFLSGERTCAIDLLFRKAPRLRSGKFVQRSDEPAVQFAERIAPQLDRTTFAIQGPPGSGKTYAGARMICRLVKAGLRVGVTAVSHKVIRNLLDAAVREAADCDVVLKPAHKVGDACDTPSPVAEIDDNDGALGALASGDANVLGGTAWLWAREDAADTLDVLFVDEAGQMSLANVLAVAQAARSVVLLGDPQQLDQPATASHPDGIGISALEHVLGGAQTMPEDSGLFLPNTWRLAPAICRFTSEVFYEGKLHSKPGLENQRLAGAGPFDGAGLSWIPAEHDGNQNSSSEEVEIVARVVDHLLAPGAMWIDEDGVERQLTGNDLRIVAPYNAQVNRLAERLVGRNVPVGTVDKFQGQEAPVVIYSMATSRPEDAPRGMEFLYSLNRLNVATSRARSAAILVASPRLFEPDCRTPRQMRLANALCRYRELATTVTADVLTVT